MERNGEGKGKGQVKGDKRRKSVEEENEKNIIRNRR
jgi:hypothetical protein